MHFLFFHICLFQKSKSQKFCFADAATKCFMHNCIEPLSSCIFCFLCTSVVVISDSCLLYFYSMCGNLRSALSSINCTNVCFLIDYASCDLCFTVVQSHIYCYHLDWSIIFLAMIRLFIYCDTPHFWKQVFYMCIKIEKVEWWAHKT